MHGPYQPRSILIFTYVSRKRGATKLENGTELPEKWYYNPKWAKIVDELDSGL